MFPNFEIFEIKFRKIFENIDKKRTAEKQLYNFKQKESAVTYLINF